MTRSTLRQLIRSLAKATPAQTPVLTLLVGLRDGQLTRPELYEKHRAAALDGASRATRAGLESAFRNAERFLLRDVRPESRSAAIIVRSGESPIRHHLQFRAALPTEVSIEAWPRLLRLVELEQRCGAFVLVRRADDCFEVCEASLGGVETRQPWRPELSRLEDPEVADRTLRIVWNVARHAARLGGADRVILAADADLAKHVRRIDARLDYNEPWSVLKDPQPNRFNDDFRRAADLNEALRAEKADKDFAALLAGGVSCSALTGQTACANAIRGGSVREIWIRPPAAESTFRPSAWQEDLVRWAALRAVRTRFTAPGGESDALLRAWGGVACLPDASAEPTNRSNVAA